MKDDHPRDDRSPDGTAPGERWTGQATGRHQWALSALGAGCLALGILLAVGSIENGDSAPLVMSIIGCIAGGLLALFGTLAFVKVRVMVDKDALEVRCGHVGLPRRRIPLHDVAEVEFVSRVNPRHWGGWGYRWRPEKGTGVVVRRGEGIFLRLGDGRTFTVTVDDAEAAVHAINARKHRSGPNGLNAA